MITIEQIKGGEGYMSRHLSANDYYSENHTVIGYWRGEAAKMLGVEGQVVEDAAFEALRQNLHPVTGEKLRFRNSDVKFHDAVLSAPKSVSIAALVGGDDRLIAAFERVTESTRQRLEHYAGHRENKGSNYNKEIFIRTGNGVAAVFHHDSSRLLEPQLHAHMVFSNHTWSEERQKWLALQPRMMGEMSKAIRQQAYRELANECEKLGYRVEWLEDHKGFRLADIDPVLDDLYSMRSQQKEKFVERYSKLFDEEPSKKRVEHFIKDRKRQATQRFVGEYRTVMGEAPSDSVIKDFVKDWRIDKMLKSSPDMVSRKQRGTITDKQFHDLDQVVRNAIANSHYDNQSQHQSQEHMAEGQSESIGTSQAIAPDRNSTRNGQSNMKAHKQSRIASRQAAVSRMEVMRRYRRGIMIARALQGNPALLITSQLVKNARRKNNETK